MRVPLFYDRGRRVVQQLYLYRLVRRLAERGLAGTRAQATEEVETGSLGRVFGQKLKSCKPHRRPGPGEREPRRAAAVEAPQAICFYRLPEAMESTVVSTAGARGAVLQLDICFYVLERVGHGYFH